MISLIIAEASIELVPKEIRNHPSVVEHAKKQGKKNSEILLDNSWHFAAMKNIKNEIKRGRPDIVHACLLEACSTPLFFENKIRVYVHTIENKVITIGNGVRLPRSYHRFAGLFEKLFSEKIIESNGQRLLEIEDSSLSDLIEEINPEKVIGFSSEGEQSSFSEIASNLNEKSCIIIGGFQKGHFFDSTIQTINQLKRISKYQLEAHVVISRILYEFEKTIFM